jgi:hypothetical protein
MRNLQTSSIQRSFRNATPLDWSSSQDANPQGSILFLAVPGGSIQLSAGMATIIAGSWHEKKATPCLKSNHDVNSHLQSKTSYFGVPSNWWNGTNTNVGRSISDWSHVRSIFIWDD